MKLTLRRGDGEELHDRRWVWGAEVADSGENPDPETIILVPPEIMVLLRRQLSAPRNAMRDLEDLIEEAANKAAAARGWRGQIDLTTDDLTF